jgi:mRNA-degrading endonuclease toxin of MazEF toxin-antitoxin module
MLLTRTRGYSYLSRVLVAEVTTHVRGIPQEVAIGRGEGVARPCVANLDHVQAIPKQWLSARIGALADARRIEVKRALGHALAWTELTSL